MSCVAYTILASNVPRSTRGGVIRRTGSWILTMVYARAPIQIRRALPRKVAVVTPTKTCLAMYPITSVMIADPIEANNQAFDLTTLYHHDSHPACTGGGCPVTEVPLCIGSC